MTGSIFCGAHEGVEIVDGFRRSLDESEICIMADAAVAMEEEFLLDIISDLEPTASLYCGSSKRKLPGLVQRRRPDDMSFADVLRHRGDDEPCLSPGSSFSSSEADASSHSSCESMCEWTTVPVVTPEQMFALGRIVKQQRSSVTSSEAGG